MMTVSCAHRNCCFAVRVIIAASTLIVSVATAADLDPGTGGVCCICPTICLDGLTEGECWASGGVFQPGGTCDPNTCPDRPANDDCSSPFVVSGVPDFGELVIAGNNLCATDDGPVLADGCSGSVNGPYYFASDVWYRYVVKACGELTVHSCDDADFDQIIAVYDAGNGCPLIDDDEIACGDDTCGVGGGPSRVTIDVQEGKDLLIRVGGFGGCGGGFCGNPIGTFNLHLSFDENCPLVNSPTLAPPPHDILKNRYISIVPGNPEIGPFDIRLTLASTLVNGVTAVGSSWWATAPVNGVGISPATCISVVSSARPLAPPDWTGCSTVHLTGCPIIPTSTYHIRTVLDLVISDPPLVAETQAKPGVKWHGDCVGFFDGVQWTPPNGATSIDDAVAAIKTFQDPNAFNATHLSVTDVHPNLNGEQMNLLVSIGDVFAIILGFRGQEYPGPQIELCP